MDEINKELLEKNAEILAGLADSKSHGNVPVNKATGAPPSAAEFVLVHGHPLGFEK